MTHKNPAKKTDQFKTAAEYRSEQLCFDLIIMTQNE